MFQKYSVNIQNWSLQMYKLGKRKSKYSRWNSKLSLTNIFQIFGLATISIIRIFSHYSFYGQSELPLDWAKHERMGPNNH